MDNPIDADDHSTSLITEDVVQNIVAELTVHAPCSDVKDCLKAYEYGKSFKQLITVFTQFNKEHIINTLNYLNVPGREDYVKSANVESLICRIQNLLPDKCGICSKIYCVKNTDASLLSCEICGQDAHNDCLVNAVNNSLPDGSEKYSTLSKEELLKFLNPLNIPSWYYICKPCSAECIPQDDKGLKKKSKKESKKGEDRVKVHPKPPVMSTSGDVDDNNATVNIANGKTASKGSGEQHPPPLNDDVINSKQSTADTVCKFFLKKCCKHGLKGEKCNFAHPAICKKLLKYGHTEKGCNKGSKCADFHPKMCFQSLKNKTCSYDNCRFYHVAGTKKVDSVHVSDDNLQESPPSQDSSLGNKSKVEHFLEIQKQSLQELRLEFLETMDMRFAALLSCLGNQNSAQANVQPQSMQVNPLGPPLVENQFHYSPQSQFVESRGNNFNCPVTSKRVMNQEIPSPIHQSQLGYNQQFPALLHQ